MRALLCIPAHSVACFCTLSRAIAVCSVPMLTTPAHRNRRILRVSDVGERAYALLLQNDAALTLTPHSAAPHRFFRAECLNDMVVEQLSRSRLCRRALP
jgi:hypothetical protein